MSSSALLPALSHALSGAGGAAISTAITYPLDLVTTRLKAQRQLVAEGRLAPGDRYSGVLDAMARIGRREGGPGAFYAGLAQDLAKSVVDQFLFFLFYNWFRARRLARARARGGGRRRHLPVVDELVVGAAAGACARAFTTPIANVVARMQTARLVGGRKGKGKEGDEAGGGGGGEEGEERDPTMRQIIDEIRAEKGLLGLWAGYSANLVLTLNPSLTFFLNSFLERRFIPEQNGNGPLQVGAVATFLMAATSKTIATATTYPVQIAKARAQVSHKPTPVNEKKDHTSDTERKPETTEGSASLSAGPAVPKIEKVALSAAQKARNLARDAVFATIVRIVRTEGVSALYDGIGGELLKAFFSHGTTMLSKDLVHKLLLRLYFAGLVLLQRYPNLLQQFLERYRSAGQQLAQIRSRTMQEVGHLDTEGIKYARGALQKSQHLVSDLVRGSQRVIMGQK
jgi:adenine nucleotide transporter 17